MKGVYVGGVNAGSGAADAGLKSGDIIIKIDDVRVNTASELQEQVGRHRPGDKLKVAYIRSEKEYEASVVLKNQSGSTDFTSSAKKSTLKSSGSLGADLSTLSPNDLKRYELKNGVKVENLKSGKLANIGIKEGFIITKINKEVVTTAEEVLELINNGDGGILIEGQYPNGTKAYYALGW